MYACAHQSFASSSLEEDAVCRSSASEAFVVKEAAKSAGGGGWRVLL